MSDKPTWKHPIPKRTDDDGLPQGVNREASPFWDLQRNPLMMMPHAIRYMHMTAAVEYLTRWAKVKDGEEFTIWDIGCGMCEMYPFLASSRKAKGVKANYVGFDADQWKIDRAMEYLGGRSRLLTLVGDFTKKSVWERWCDGYPLMKNPAQVAIMTEVVEHVSKKSFHNLLRRMARMGVGWIVGTTPEASYSGKYGDDGHGWHVHEYSTAEFKEHAVQAGWVNHYTGWMRSHWRAIDYSPFMHKDVVKQVAGFPFLDHAPVEGSMIYFVLRHDDNAVDPPF